MKPLETYDQNCKIPPDATRLFIMPWAQERHGSPPLINTTPQAIYNLLCKDEDAAITLKSLPPITNDLPDEDTAEFQSALNAGKENNSTYQKAINAIEQDDPNRPTQQANAERALQDTVRDKLCLPPRPKSNAQSEK